MNRRQFLASGAGGLLAAANAQGQGVGETDGKQSAEARITGSFFDLTHLNLWDAALELVCENAQGVEKARPILSDLGIALWTNCEAFQFEPTPDGRAACIAGPIERFKQRITMQPPLAEKLICYQYQGVMNRHTDLVDIGHPGTGKLYQGYVDYLNEHFPGRFNA